MVFSLFLMTVQKLLEADTSRECVAVSRCFSPCSILQGVLWFLLGLCRPSFYFYPDRILQDPSQEPVPAATVLLPFLVEGFRSEFH